MIWIAVILVILTTAIYILYRIGKKVKEKEELFKKMMSEQDAKSRLSKYARKSTPKVPRINEAAYKYKREK